MKKIVTSLFVFLAGFTVLKSQTTQTFNYTGAVQTFTVPPCVSSITIEAYGAQGGVAAIGGTGGLGGYSTGILSVTPGDILYFYVGGTNGYNGGGTGGANGNPVYGYGGTGGGASDARLNGTTVSNRVIVAGGGGGAGSNGTWPGCQVAGPAGNGGDGGGLTGSSGTFGVGTPCNCAGGGGDGASGGTQISGGIHGNYAGNTACLRANWTPGQDGTLAQGGNGSSIYYNGTGGGGGGGGGYYGGGSGGNGSDTTPGGGGGGGSSWTGTLTSSATTAGLRTGDGMVVITYLSIPASPTSITGNTSACAGSNLTFSIAPVAGATSYTWTVPAGSTINSGQGTVTINVAGGSTSGNVTVTANNSCGSSAPTQLVLSINASPTVSITPISPVVCIGSSIVLTASGATSYSWSSGGNAATENVSPTTSTSYTVTGTDANGCTNTATTTVTVNPVPTVVASVNNAAICFGSSVNLTATGAVTYLWQPINSSGATVTTTPTSTTTYTVTGTDANGCTGTATTTVTMNPLPTVVATVDNATICLGSSVNLTATGAVTYLWQPINSSGSTVNTSPTSTTTFSVTGTDANGCLNTSTLTVTVNALPTIIATGSPLTVCSGSPTTLSASGALTYLWQPINLTGATVTDSPSTATTYTVSGTDVNGCIGTATVNISVNATPTVSILASPTAICVGSSVTLTGSGANTYNWMPGNLNGATISAFPISTTTYTLTGTGSNGCVGTATTTVTVNSNPILTLSASSLTPCLDDGIVTLTASPVGGVWTGTAVTGNSFNPTSAGVGPHILTYNYTDSVTGCSAASVITINVNACTGIVESSFANGIEIFPNPNNGIFNISVNANIGDLLIEVTDLEGRVVFSLMENNVNAGFIKEIHLVNVSSGMYLMKLSSGNEQKLEKISVQK